MSSTPDWQQEIERIEEECRLAFLAQDVARLRQLWSKDLVVNSPLNRIHDCATVLDLLGRGVIRHEWMEQQIESVTRHGGVVVVMGRDAVRNTADGPVIARRFTNVWASADGSWQLVARQATHITA
jgi:ketosteroid isomerase-like protein